MADPVLAAGLLTLGFVCLLRTDGVLHWACQTLVSRRVAEDCLVLMRMNARCFAVIALVAGLHGICHWARWIVGES